MTIKLDEILKNELERRKLSINEVAKECKIAPSVLHGWINGTLPSAKNLHHIQTLSKFLGISAEDMLFNSKEDSTSRLILFSSTFMDGDTQYKLTIEKIKEQ